MPQVGKGRSANLATERGRQMPRTHSNQGALLVSATSSSRRDRSASLRKLLERLHRSRRSHRLCAEVGRVALAVRLLVRGLDALLVDVFAIVKVLRDLRDWKGCTGRQSWPEKRLLWLDSVVVPALEMTISSCHVSLQEQALEAVIGIKRRRTYGLSGTSRCPRRIRSRREKQPGSR